MNTSDKQQYPRRGQLSEDGKLYTHMDGSVYEKVSESHVCSVADCKKCSNVPFYCMRWSRIEVAYVQTEEERDACDMARNMIEQCSYFRGLAIPAHSRQSCGRCSYLSNKVCPAREYLAKHGCSDAWEVKQ